jgi:3-oxoadipate enol-lactonase
MAFENCYHGYGDLLWLAIYFGHCRVNVAAVNAAWNCTGTLGSCSKFNVGTVHMPYLKRANQPDIFYALDDYTDPWKNAPYLVLQHGYGRSSRFWYSWVPYLSRFYKVVRPDIRGLGLSSAEFDIEREFTFEACSADLLAIIDDLGAESVHYCGESMGGILGIALAAHHPQRVRTLTLVSTPVHVHDVSSTIKEMGGMEAWAKATNSSFRFAPDTDPGLVNWYKEEFVKNRPDVQLAMAGFTKHANTAANLSRIQAPVLGLYPTSGQITNEEQEKTLVGGIRNLRMVHLPTSFHKVQLMFPAACAGHLLHFISQHDGVACHER